MQVSRPNLAKVLLLIAANMVCELVQSPSWNDYRYRKALQGKFPMDGDVLLGFHLRELFNGTRNARLTNVETCMFEVTPCSTQ